MRYICLHKNELNNSPRLDKSLEIAGGIWLEFAFVITSACASTVGPFASALLRSIARQLEVRGWHRLTLLFGVFGGALFRVEAPARRGGFLTTSGAAGTLT